jgi:thioesterase domain-containing protein
MDETSMFPTVEELAETYLKDVRKIQAHGPYQLCGYSSFGLVPYEMARKLLAQGEQVSFLGMFDVWHPQFRQLWTSTEVARFRATRILVRCQKYGRFISEGRFRALGSAMSEFIAKRARVVRWRTVRSLYRSTNRALPKSMAPLESVASHRAYIPLLYPGRLALFRPYDLFARTLRDQKVGWDRCVREVDVHFVSGDHGSMVQEPYIRDLVSKIEPYLLRA